MNKKRIAILADFPWSFFADGATGRGGGQGCTWLVQIAEQFSKECPFDIHWISISRTGTYGHTQSREWGGQYFHKIQGIRASIDLRLGFHISKFQLLRIIQKLNVDLVHCWGTETAYPVVCDSTTLPVILSMQGILTAYANIGMLPDAFYWNALVKREPRYLECATLVTCESQWGVDRVREVVPQIKVRQIEYGVNPSFYQITWQPDTKQPYILFSGSIDQRKGVDTLLDAWELVATDDMILRIAGDGPLYKSLKDRNVLGVEWLGLLNWQEMQRQLAGASCLVLPTRADTSPNVVKEARVIGLPVITTIHGGQAGYIRDGENGIIVNPLNAQNLAEALSCLMNNPQLARAMGAARHAEDRAYFQPSNTAQGFLDIYKQLTEEFSLATHSLNS